MPGNRFNPQGEHSANVNRYFLGLALAAKQEGASPDQADYSWTTYLGSHSDQVEAASRDHPGTGEDSTVRVRENYHRQKKRFTNWLTTASGYPQAFAQRLGFIDSGLGGSLASGSQEAAGGDNNHNNNNNQEEDEDEDDEDPGVPLADNPVPPPPVPEPEPAPAPAPVPEQQPEPEPVLVEEEEMNIKSIYLKDCKALQDVCGANDVLICRIVAPAGTNLSTLKMRPCKADPNKVDVWIDMDECSCLGESGEKPRWRRNNDQLSEAIKQGFDLQCEDDCLTGCDYERVVASFTWPEGQRSQMNPVDPYVLGLRRRPTRANQSLFEIKRCSVKGPNNMVTASWIITAFFFTEQDRHARRTGDLRMDDSEDEDDYYPRSPRNNRGSRSKRARRVEESDDDDDDDDDDMDLDDDRKPAGRPRKKSPPFAAQPALWFGTILAALGMAGAAGAFAMASSG